MSRRDALAFLAAALPLLFATWSLARPGVAAELRELPGTATSSPLEALAVSDAGDHAFGGLFAGPVRWVRQPDGSFAAEDLDPRQEFSFERSAIDGSSDGSIALIESAVRDADGTEGVWRWSAATGWQLVQAGAIDGSAMSGDAATVAWIRTIANPPLWTHLLESNAGLIDFFALDSPFPGHSVRELSGDGGVAVGTVPSGGVRHPAVWTFADGTWNRVLASLPPGATSAEAIDVSDDGVYALVADSELGTPRCWLWSELHGYQDLGSAGGEPCACGAVNGDGSVVAGVCRPFDPVLMRWRAGIGWESVLPGAESVTDLSADGRYAVGEAQTSGLYWADLDSLPTACANGEDDDGDGSVDLADAGCASAADTSERDESVDCDDGWDDDGDGRRDYRPTQAIVGDPGCAGPRDATETDPLLVCDDGIDNDDDGYRDHPSDPGCPFPEARPENPPCDDGIDNDADEFVDFDDPDCTAGWPYWESVPALQVFCGLGAELVPALSLLTALRRRTCERPATPSARDPRSRLRPAG